jgi:hypothetical protein
MSRVILLILMPLLLASCAMQERTEPPAPIVESSRSAPAPRPVQAAPAPKPEPKPAAPQPTKVYAYTPPESIPDPQPQPPAEAVPAPAPGQSASAGGAADAPTSPQPAKPRPEVAAQPPKPAPAAVPPANPPAKPPAEKPPAAVADTGARAPEPLPQPVTPPPSAPPAPEVASAPERSALAPADMPPAVDALARRAEQQRQTGDYAGSAATLERALRIQPQQAYLWNRLARVRLEQGLGPQAGNLAARSNTLAGDQANLKKNNWEVIATVRRQAGDIEGALEAERMAGGG